MYFNDIYFVVLYLENQCWRIVRKAFSLLDLVCQGWLTALHTHDISNLKLFDKNNATKSNTVQTSKIIKHDIKNTFSMEERLREGTKPAGLWTARARPHVHHSRTLCILLSIVFPYIALDYVLCISLLTIKLAVLHSI